MILDESLSVKELIDEPCVKQMHDGVFDPTDIDVCGHGFAFLWFEWSNLIVRVQIPQVIPTRVDKRIQCVRLPFSCIETLWALC